MNYAKPDREDNHDIAFVLALIDKIKSKYNIDEERIFMQGMSNGSMFTTQFEKYYGNILAGGSGAGGSIVNLKLFYDKDWNGMLSIRQVHFRSGKQNREKMGFRHGANTVKLLLISTADFTG